MKDLSNVMMIEFTEDYGNWSENLLAVFNINKISEDDVIKFIHGDRGFSKYHPDIMMVYPEQWESVFGEAGKSDTKTDGLNHFTKDELKKIPHYCECCGEYIEQEHLKVCDKCASEYKF